MAHHIKNAPPVVMSKDSSTLAEKPFLVEAKQLRRLSEKVSSLEKMLLKAAQSWNLDIDLALRETLQLQDLLHYIRTQQKGELNGSSRRSSR